VEVTAHLILSELHLQEEDDVSGDTDSQDSEAELQSTEVLLLCIYLMQHDVMYYNCIT